MKALSIKQPWAYLIINGYKDIENRNWPTRYRGPLLIHAPKGWSYDGYDFIINRMDLWVPSPEDHVFQALIGTVEVVDCVDWHESKWFFGDWGFVLENPREFKTPIPYRGQLGLFDVPDWVIEKEASHE